MTALQLGDRIANGTRSTVYALGMDYVVKVPLAATPDSWIQYEAIYTAAVGAAGAPAPRFVETARYEGRLVSVYERLTGPSMWEYVVANPGDAESMGRVLGQLHGELFDLVPPVKLPNQRDRLACKIRSATASLAFQEAGYENQIPKGVDRLALCHGDVHPGNVILTVDGPKFIDWFDACRGDSLGDVTRSMILLGGPETPYRAVPHLPGATPEIMEPLYSNYCETILNVLSPTDASLSLWIGIEAAARLGEGLAVADLVAIWEQYR